MPAITNFRVPVLAVLSAGSLWAYFTSHLVGPVDARWYGNVMTDYLTQLRAGTFPIFSGATLYAFNGAVHPFRTAPWHLLLAALVDAASGRHLSPLAVQHATAIISFMAAVLGLYAGLVRWRPQARSLAFGLCCVYATCPAITASFLLHDMYMTLMAAPFLVGLYLFVARSIDTGSVGAHVATGLFAGALWWCHPPSALLGSIVAAGCLIAHAAISGFPRRALILWAAGCAAFGLVAGPYFASMAEIAPDPGDPVARVLMPALGLALFATAIGGTIRSRGLRWLALLPVAGLCLEWFKPTLLPFAVLWTLLSLAGLWVVIVWPRLKVKNTADLALFIAAMVAAVAADLWVPRHGLPYAEAVSGAVANAGRDPGRFFRPLFHNAGDQPGAACWMLLLAALICGSCTRSAFARIGLVFAGILVVALGLVPHASLLMWLNSPDEFISIIGIAYELRILPVLTPLVIIAAFPILADVCENRHRARRFLILSTCVVLPWTFWEHYRLLRVTADYRQDAAATARAFRSENSVLERYTWDLLLMPRYFSNGVMDPNIECRFWAYGDPARPRIDPDRVALALESRADRGFDVIATPDPTAPQWLTLSPPIEIKPGERKLLRFDFLGTEPTGWLLFRGQDIYREYILPSSGEVRAFGAADLNVRTVSLWNSGAKEEKIQMLVKREGPGAQSPLPSGAYWHLYMTDFDARRAPIEVRSLLPLRLRIDAPVDGYLETFRSHYPGYEATVDGLAAPVRKSGNGLVSLQLSRGRHEVEVRFVGTPRLRAAERWTIASWILVGAWVTANCGMAWRRAKREAHSETVSLRWPLKERRDARESS